MNTHNIGFYEEMAKIVFFNYLISYSTHFICSSSKVAVMQLEAIGVLRKICHCGF